MTNGFHRILLLRASLRAPKVAGTNNFGSPTGQPFNSRQCCTNTKIIGNHTCIIGSVHRNIEIGTNKNPFAPHITEVLKYWDTHHMQRLLSYVQCKINETVRITPLVVVPTKDLYQRAHAHCQVAVKYARVRVCNNVTRHDWRIGVFENAL